jgi:hypothetical protein
MYVFLLLSLLVAVNAGCDNACSGHGTCTTNGVCECYDNWGVGMAHDSADCSERKCPYEFSWVDAPDKAGNHHKYTECASKGICDRESGLCECFDGYEGKACQRTSCPNSCSGHGICAYIEDLEEAAGWNVNPTSYFSDDYPSHPYYYWDKTKTRGCQCDPEWFDVDCSKRMCPYGNDVMDHRLDLTVTRLHQKQRITLTALARSSGLNDTTYTEGRTFALTFKSKMNETYTTQPIKLETMTGPKKLQTERAIEYALKSLPNRVIDSVTVKINDGFHDVKEYNKYIEFEFNGEHVQGTQNLLQLRNAECLDGCSPYITGLMLAPVQARQMGFNVSETQLADFNSFECGRRGKCDYDSGVCECFDGYTGLACNTVSALV